jgi:hypothetical protein
LNKSDHLKIQAAVLNYIDRTTWQNPYAVTLTLKQGISENGAYTALDTIRASENLRHFRNRLNQSVFGKGYKKKQLSVRCFAVYEGTATVRGHYHLCLDRPENVTREQLEAHIEKQWRATTWGRKIIDIEPCSHLDGWLNYITKRRSKSDIASSIDWFNTTRGVD